MNEPILELKGLTVEYMSRQGTARAINEANLSINKGEVVGLVGESGCGKSTTGLTILRLLPEAGQIKQGKILFKGEDIAKLSEKVVSKRVRGKEISMVIQNPQNALNPVFTVGEQLIDVLKYNEDNFKMKETNLRERAINILNEMGIAEAEHRIDEYPHQFSGGMKQRVMLAMAFICNPSLLIADEPTTALDVTVEAQILDLLRDLVEEYQTSVLYITHDLSVISEVTDRTAVMYAGNIVEVAPTEVLFEDPKHPYTKGLLSCLPGESTRHEVLPTISGTVPDLTELPSGCNFCPRCDEAIDRCQAEEPQLTHLPNGHSVACLKHEEPSEEGGKNYAIS